MLDYLILHPWLFGLLVVYTLAWKALVLWHAARGGQLIWFLVLLATNTFGILDALYYFFFRKEKKNP